MDSVDLHMSGTAYFFIARVQELNRITIPENIAKKIEIKKGDTVSGYIGKIKGE